MKTSFLLATILFVGFAMSAQIERPNIVWFTCEDISPYLDFYGDSTARTPNLDRLANESMIYTNAFAAVGVCAPSRSAIITGMYPTSIGTMHMRTAKDIQSWGKRNYSGKSNAVDINGDTVPHYSAVIPPDVKCFTEYLRKAGYYCINNQKTDYQFAAPVTAWDENNAKGHWRNTPKGQAFFYVFNHGVTHESRMWVNKKLPQTVSPDNVPLPVYFPDDSIVRQDVARNYSNIELLDQQIGNKIRELKDSGLWENTIVFFFSDHGGPLPRGKRLHYDSGLRTPLMVRIPEKYKKTYGISGKAKKAYIDEMMSFVDLAPTMLSLAGIKIPKYMQGQAFLGYDKAKKERRYIFGSGDRFDEHTDRIRVVRDKRYLYVRNYHPELPSYKDIGYRKKMDMMNQLLLLHKEGKLNKEQDLWFRMTKPKEEFYDCNTDPDNVHNLINESKYASKIEEMRKEMDKWLKETGDMAVVPEKEMFLKMWPGGIQPRTENPVIVKSRSKVKLRCNTQGASIAYIISDNEIEPDLNSCWKLYYKPIPLQKGKYLYVMAGRIGFKDSEIIKIRF